jgi:hypothetical protein
LYELKYYFRIGTRGINSGQSLEGAGLETVWAFNLASTETEKYNILNGRKAS